MFIEVFLILVGLSLLFHSDLRAVFYQRNPTPQRNAASAIDDETMATTAGEEQLHNIYYTAWLLRQKLVSDVVSPIMHHAGLFQRHVKHFRPTKEVVVTQRSAPYTCLASKPIQSSARLQNPVRKVVVAIRSCDQGWVSDRNSASWSWFTAGVIPRMEEDDEGAEDRLEQLSIRTGDGDDRFIDREREIFRNDVASRAHKLYIVEWTVDSEDETERRWVRSLRNGDRVVVRAWAQYAGVSEQRMKQK